MTDRQRTVALLIDYDNLQICYSRDAPGTQLDLGAVVAFAQTYGRVMVARAYAEWNLLGERMMVYKSGIEPAFAPVMRPENSSREGKSLADTVMVSDGVDLLWTLDPDVLVLVTSDKDMIPLVRLAKQRGTLVVVLGSDLTAVPLLEMANDFVTYRHLVRELGRGDERAAASRVGEESPVRRVREPFAAREVAAAREASAREPRVPQSRSRARAEAAPAPVRATASTPPPARARVPLADTTELAETAMTADPVQLDEFGQPIPARRRRRRGGRGRRIGLGTDTALPTEPQADSADESQEPLSAAEELATASAVGEHEDFDAAIEAALQQHEAAPEPEDGPRIIAVTRRRPVRARSEPASVPEVRATEAAESESTDGQVLKPWERWPEPVSASSTPNSRRRIRGPGSNGESTRPEMAAEVTPPTAPEPPVDAAPEPPNMARQEGLPLATLVEPVAAMVGVAADQASADSSSAETEPTAAPARRRRVRRRPASAEVTTEEQPAE